MTNATSTSFVVSVICGYIKAVEYFAVYAITGVTNWRLFLYGCISIILSTISWKTNSRIAAVSMCLFHTYIIWAEYMHGFVSWFNLLFMIVFIVAAYGAFKSHKERQSGPLLR